MSLDVDTKASKGISLSIDLLIRFFGLSKSSDHANSDNWLCSDNFKNEILEKVSVVKMIILVYRVTFSC